MARCVVKTWWAALKFLPNLQNPRIYPQNRKAGVMKPLLRADGTLGRWSELAAVLVDSALSCRFGPVLRSGPAVD